MSSRLDGVRAKIERAKKHIGDLDGIWWRFKKAGAYRISSKTDRKTGERRYYVKSLRKVPTEVPILAGDAIQNLRSALDQLAFQMFLVGPEAGNAKLIRKIYFPIFANSAKMPEAGFVGKIQVFRDNEIKALRALEPYKGGNG